MIENPFDLDRYMKEGHNAREDENAAWIQEQKETANRIRQDRLVNAMEGIAHDLRQGLQNIRNEIRKSRAPSLAFIEFGLVVIVILLLGMVLK